MRAKAVTLALATISTLALALALGLEVRAAAAQTQSAATTKEMRTIWQGVYTAEQATRGKALYELVCARCHNIDFLGSPRGPSLKTGFLARWQHQSAATWFDKTRYNMPSGTPGILKDQEYLDVLVYVLQVNGAPPGPQPLLPNWAELDAVALVPKDADLSRVPNFALAQVVGCLTADDTGTWLLTQAAQPLWASQFEPSPSTLREAAAQRLGGDTYQLASVGAYEPVSKQGRKVVARGRLYRDRTRNRLSLTSLNVVSDRCAE